MIERTETRRDKHLVYYLIPADRHVEHCCTIKHWEYWKRRKNLLDVYGISESALNEFEDSYREFIHED